MNDYQNGFDTSLMWVKKNLPNSYARNSHER